MFRIRYILFFLIALLVYHGGYAQISPGELTEAHKQLEGISNCSKCHELGKKVSSQKCLDCHKEISKLINNNQGFHISKEVKGKECFSCHNEHYGRNFAIVRFDTVAFNHLDAGFALIGKHDQITCSKCHNGTLIREPVSQKKGETYLGLGTVCLACHEDYHQKTLSQECSTCHNQNSFKPAENFNHSTTRFRLVGKHQSVDCIKCHKVSERAGKKFQEFKGIGFQNCTSCHVDVHNRKFGNDCRRCHNEDSFHTIASLNNFNHNQTNFPLLGKHVYVDCKTCHKRSYTTKIKHTLCSDCHTDYHKGQLQKPGISIDCSDCHSNNGYTPSLYTIERHNASGFRLDGAHLATPCTACHKKDTTWNFKISDSRCLSCHENVHYQKIDPEFMINDNCLLCHKTGEWHTVTFDHNETTFQLKGKHATLTCRKCHFTDPADGPVMQQFNSLTGACTECHTDPHGGQFEITGLVSCFRCHTNENWKPDLFDHNKARFVLDGKHANLDCIKCHKPDASDKQNRILYKNNKLKCSDCHS